MYIMRDPRPAWRRRDGLADKPGFVPAGRYRHCRRQSSISGNRCRFPPAAYPDARAGSPQTHPVWPCSEWGLPSCPGRPGHWWSLTPPFHPYPRINAGGLFSVALACGFPRVGVTHHPALRSPDFPRQVRSENRPDAIAWPTRPAVNATFRRTVRLIRADPPAALRGQDPPGVGPHPEP